jgi:hypothetical protein
MADRVPGSLSTKDDDDDDLDRLRRQAAGLRWDTAETARSDPAPGQTRLDRLLTEAREFMDGGQHRSAIGRLEQARRLDPTLAMAPYLMALCYMELKNLVRANEMFGLAATLVDEPQLARTIGAGQRDCWRMADNLILEPVRQSVRAADVTAAATEFGRCRTQLYDQERAEVMAKYLEDRRAAAEGTAPTVDLDPDTLQEVIEWLTDEEITLAEAAFRSRDLAGALRSCEAAARIDDRGSRVAYVHAYALLYRVKGKEEAAGDLVDLERAAELARRASTNRRLRAQAEKVHQATLRTADERRQRQAARAEIAPLEALTRRYNSFEEHYGGKTMFYWVEVGNASSSLAQMAADLPELRQRYAKEPDAIAVLDALAERIAAWQRVFRKLRG